MCSPALVNVQEGRRGRTGLGFPPGHFGDVLPIQSLGLILKKWKQTQQKQTCIHNKIFYNIKLTQKQARFRRRLRPPAWERNGSILKEVALVSQGNKPLKPVRK